MQSFQRAFGLFSIVTAIGLLIGCGGPGTPVPGGSDPASEAADAALAPETSAETSTEATPPAAEDATEPAPEAEQAEAKTQDPEN